MALLLLLALLLVDIFRKGAHKEEPDSFKVSEIFMIMVSHALGTGATFFLIQKGLGVVQSASLVGLLGYGLAQILQRLDLMDVGPNIYCGAFVGMVSSSLLTNYSLMAASLLSGLLYIFLADIFHGYGGKLGSIAFISCMITIEIVRHL